MEWFKDIEWARWMPIVLQLIQLSIVGGTATIALRAFRETRLSAQTAARIYTRSALKDVVLREQSERPFEERPNAPLPGSGGSIKSLRAAKTIARREAKKNYPEWCKLSRIDCQYNWQNHVAFETAEGLQQFGIAAFTGSIPLHSAVASVADVVIDDWIICVAWIKSYQEKEKMIKTVSCEHNEKVFYHRRHAEWIFLVSLAWLRRQGWSYDDVSYMKGENVLPSDEELEHRLQVVTKADEGLLPDNVGRDVFRLTGIKLDF